MSRIQSYYVNNTNLEVVNAPPNNQVVPRFILKRQTSGANHPKELLQLVLVRQVEKVFPTHMAHVFGVDKLQGEMVTP